VQILVRDNNVERAPRVLKKKMQREGVFREMKLRRHFEKPSERKTAKRRKLSAERANSREKRCNATACCR
jgi:small subunit ribosomal protein S21